MLNKAKQLVVPGLAAFALSYAGITSVSAQQMDAAASQALIAKLQQGPSTINVSKYPQGIQDNYEILSTKCTQCHKLSVPINAEFVLPDEWSNYVKLMMHKPGSGIGGDEGKKIYDFLVYDSSVRKKAALDAKLAKLSPTQKADAEAKIKAVHAKYDK
jgi:cytochrome c5